MNTRYFDYLHLRFDLSQARKLASRQPPVRMLIPQGWLPLAMLVEGDQSGETPIVVTLACNNAQTMMVIDGLAKARQAVQRQEFIPTVVLSLLNSMNILTARMDVKRNIKDTGKQLGLT